MDSPSHYSKQLRELDPPSMQSQEKASLGIKKKKKKINTAVLIERIFSNGHPVVSSKKSFLLFRVASAGWIVSRIPNYIITKATLKKKKKSENHN